MHEIIAVFGFLLILAVLIIFLALKRWLYSWEGVLKEKQIKEEYGFKDTNDSDFSPGYTQRFILVFETSDGELIRVEVDSIRFEAAIVGVRYMKVRKSWRFKRYS